MPINAIRPTAGLDQQSLLIAIENAVSVVLHAAVYNNFAHSEVGDLIRKKLQDGSLEQLDIIELQPDKHWQNEFSVILRPKMQKTQVMQMFIESSLWSKELKASFPQQVNRVLTQALPLQPIMLIGDVLFVGQYAHSSLVSAQGIWLQIACDLLGLKSGELQSWYHDGLPLKLCNSWPLAISRYVDECRQAALFAAEASHVIHQ